MVILVMEGVVLVSHFHMQINDWIVSRLTIRFDNDSIVARESGVLTLTKKTILRYILKINFK